MSGDNGDALKKLLQKMEKDTQFARTMMAMMEERQQVQNLPQVPLVRDEEPRLAAQEI